MGTISRGLAIYDYKRCEIRTEEEFFQDAFPHELLGLTHWRPNPTSKRSTHDFDACAMTSSQMHVMHGKKSENMRF